MVRSKQAGFTLVEIVIVLAISSGLAIIAFNGFSLARNNAQFSDSLEQAKEQVLSARTAAFTNVDTAGARGTNQSTVTLGKLLTFTPGSSTVDIATLTTANPDYTSATPNLTPLVQTNQLASPPSFGLKWGVTYVGYSLNGLGAVVNHAYKVAFSHSLTNSATQTAGSPTWAGTIAFDQLAPSTGTVSLHFQNFDGSRNATITIDFSNGGIVRAFQ